MLEYYFDGSKHGGEKRTCGGFKNFVMVNMTFKQDIARAMVVVTVETLLVVVGSALFYWIVATSFHGCRSNL
jgi:hypothetical protein